MKLRKIVTAAGIAAVIALGAGACGGSSSGFHNMTTLERSVHAQVLQHGWAAASVLCVPDSNGAQCLVKDGTGHSESLAIVIAPNGKSWVTS